MLNLRLSVLGMPCRCGASLLGAVLCISLAGRSAGSPWCGFIEAASKLPCSPEEAAPWLPTEVPCFVAATARCMQQGRCLQMVSGLHIVGWP